jgi:SAM-dependent methyltransferase
MDNLFAGDSMGYGYANARPAVHPHVIGIVRNRLNPERRAKRALDIGCGAGLSTRQLPELAEFCVGMDSACEMLKWSKAVAPRSCFAAARAEALPFRTGTIDLITAAGSLNYADWRHFFPEAARVLSASGRLVVYDFSPGRWLRDCTGLENWFDQFIRRYPAPPDGAIPITREILSDCDPRFRLEWYENFEVVLPMSLPSYVNYMMTETNVTYAISRGQSEAEVRGWCASTLEPLLGDGQKEVLFRGYAACLARN